MSRMTASNENIESKAIDFVSRYPIGFLSNPAFMECEANLWILDACINDANRLHTPRTLIEGSHTDTKAFEMAYLRAKKQADCKPFVLIRSNKATREA